MNRFILHAVLIFVLVMLPVSGVSSEASIMPLIISDDGGVQGGGRPIKDIGYDYPDAILWGDTTRSPGYGTPNQALWADVNGNGVPDFVFYTSLRGTAKWSVGVFFDATLSSIQNRGFASADYKVISPKKYPWESDWIKQHPMTWFAVADVNGDRFDDIIFSMPVVDLGGGVWDERGEVYVVLGNTRENLGALRDLAVNPAEFTFIGKDQGDRAGWALAAGDINGDGRADVIIGAPKADGPNNGSVDGGEVYAITTIDYARRTMDLTESNVNLYLYGEANQLYGRAVAAGNLNGDATPCPANDIDDIIVAPYLGPRTSVKMVFGSPTIGGTKRLATDADWTSAYGLIPRAPTLLTGDVNNDGIDDLIASDAGYGDYITYGSRSSIATAANAQIIDTFNPGGNLGFASAVADFDGDGLNDLAILAPRTIGRNHEYTTPVGEAHIVWGKPGGISGTIDLKLESTHLSLYGNNGTGPTLLSSNFQGPWNSTYGYIHAGDLDSDGRAELFFGGSLYQNTYIYRISPR